jgi:hypothetical protein
LEGGDYDLLKEGQNRFVKKTSDCDSTQNRWESFCATRFILGTAAMCADDFNMLVEICDGDKTLAVNADPSHCWEERIGNALFESCAADLRVSCEELRYSARCAFAENGAGDGKSVRCSL